LLPLDPFDGPFDRLRTALRAGARSRCLASWLLDLAIAKEYVRTEMVSEDDEGDACL
jgi:hypothetical protein